MIEKLDLERMQDTLRYAARLDALNNRARDLDWLAANLPTLADALRDRERLEFLFESLAAHYVDRETDMAKFHLDFDTGWCEGYRDAIDEELR